MVKLAMGIRPDVIQLADRTYMDICHGMTNSIQLVAIGPISIDLDINHVLVDKQVHIFKEFVHMANVSGKPLRIYYTKDYDISFDLAEKGLPRGHPVHLVIFNDIIDKDYAEKIVRTISKLFQDFQKPLVLLMPNKSIKFHPV